MQIAALPVGEPSQYQGSFPRFGQPKEIAHFSRDAFRKVHFDRRALRTFQPPQLPAVLDEGFEDYSPKDSADDPAPLGDVFDALSNQRLQLQPGQILTFR